MKNFCVIHILLFILLMLVYQCANAQDYVVTPVGDTIKGEVKPITFGPEKKVQVTTSDKKKNLYSIFQIRSFSFKNEIFHPVKGEKGYVFMKLLKPGYLSLYGFQLENQVTYDGLYLRKKDGTGIEVPNLTFKRQMTKFLSECEDVTARIDKGELGRKSINQIVESFNSCIENKTNDQAKTNIASSEQMKKISSWDVLEEKVKAKSDFEGKNDALEMISDIKGKIKRNEKIPNFLLEGLKNSLAQANLTAELDSAMNDIKN